MPTPPTEPREIVVTTEIDLEDTSELVTFETRFAWDGASSSASFHNDIADPEEGASSPAVGWLSWHRGPTVVVAWEDVGRQASRASTLEVPDLSGAAEPSNADWAALAHALTLDVLAEPEPPVDWQYVGNVEVDSGQLLIADPAYVLPNAERGTPGVDYARVLEADGAMCRVDDLPVLLVRNFGGDGSFPVFGDMEDGELYRLSVAFVEPDED